MARTISANLQSLLSRLAITRGVVFILFGLLALVWPGLTLITLGILLGIWLIIGGVTGLVSDIVSRRHMPHWIFRIIVNLLEVGIGAYLVQRPHISVATVIALVSIVLIVEGVVEVIIGLIYPAFVDNRVLAVTAGVLGVVTGILIWRYPVTGGLAFVWLLGLYALLIGAINIAAAVEIEK